MGHAVNMDPKSLGLVAWHICVRRQLRQLDIENVAADKTGVAFGTLDDVGPFLRADKSVTVDPLAILTTTPVPPASQGLMPVVDLRFPTIYLPTKEIVPIEGSIVQLGDSSVVRKQDASVASTQPIETKTFKVIVWHDEWARPVERLHHFASEKDYRGDAAPAPLQGRPVRPRLQAFSRSGGL